MFREQNRSAKGRVGALRQCPRAARRTDRQRHTEPPRAPAPGRPRAAARQRRPAPAPRAALRQPPPFLAVSLLNPCPRPIRRASSLCCRNRRPHAWGTRRADTPAGTDEDDGAVLNQTAGPARAPALRVCLHLPYPFGCSIAPSVGAFSPISLSRGGTLPLLAGGHAHGGAGRCRCCPVAEPQRSLDARLDVTAAGRSWRSHDVHAERQEGGDRRRCAVQHPHTARQLLEKLPARISQGWRSFKKKTFPLYAELEKLYGACRRGASRSMGPCSWPCPTRWASSSPSSGSVLRSSSEGSTASSGARARTTSTTSRVQSRHRKLWPQQATTTTMTTKRRSSSSSRRSRTRAPATRSLQLKDLFAMEASSPLRHQSG
ncbi:uncharacterized protein [Miscanthus floridulus]|uniref:uncharacterized protein n=1 Tax=Miscanthus floridulus TaxID=154761 RepID=UPI003459606A